MATAAVLAVTAVAGNVASNKARHSAAAQSREASELANERITEGAKQARADLERLFPAAQQSAQEGFAGALGVLGSSIPEQARLFQQGNVAGQQAILAGLPQQQNAILGGNVDLSGFQPFKAQLPDFNDFNFSGAVPGFGATNDNNSDTVENVINKDVNLINRHDDRFLNPGMFRDNIANNPSTGSSFGAVNPTMPIRPFNPFNLK